jgi:hypothetical protein
VSNLITDWREQLVTYLAGEFPDAVVEAGVRPEGPSRDKDRICVFWPGISEAGDINYANPTMTIRFWVKDPKTAPLRPTPRDDTPLEQAGWDLMTALQPVRTTLDPDGRYYFRVTSIVPDREEWGVEASLFAWTVNPAAIA